jgi:hypothetical protein
LELVANILLRACKDRPCRVISRRVKRIASKSAPSPTNAVSAENAIDVVIAWVDGRDPKHRRKRERYLADPGADDQPEQVASKERRFFRQ